MKHSEKRKKFRYAIFILNGISIRKRRPNTIYSCDAFSPQKVFGCLTDVSLFVVVVSEMEKVPSHYFYINPVLTLI